jgi:hypothetical protein
MSQISRKSSSKQSQQASRKLMPVPDELNKLLILVNDLPPLSPDVIDRMAMSDFQDGLKVSQMGGNFYPNWEKEGDRPMDGLEIYQNLVFLTLSMVPETLKDFIGTVNSKTLGSLLLNSEMQYSGDYPKNETLIAAYNRYGYLFKAKEVLEEIAKNSTTTYQFSIPVPTPMTADSDSLISIQPNDKGELDFCNSPLLQMLHKALKKVDYKRIGKCPICNKIFWRGRTDQRACSPDCGHALRNADYRERWREEIKQRRYERAQAKEAAAKLTSSKKPTKKQKGK